MSIIKAFKNALKKKNERGWEKIYVFVDIHETILKPTYKIRGEKEFYRHAKEALQLMSDSDNVSLGLYTCSYPDEIQEYLEFFKENNIIFEHVNENLEVDNDAYGYFEDKPYFNVLLDDKAGFDAEEDWIKLKFFAKYKHKLK